MEKNIDITSVITCPHCLHKKEEIIPPDKGVFIYQCESCEKLLIPSSGGCCVFCDFGTIGCHAVEKTEEDNIE